MNLLTGPIIQNITPNDFAECFEIERQCFPIIEMFAKHELPSIIEQSKIAIKAIFADKMVGYALARYANKVGYLYSSAVLPHYRNKGIGTSLLQERMHRLWRECNVVQAHTRTANREAIKLLSKVGFIARGYEPDFYHEGVDATLWEVRMQ
jgi:ribosomal protein S18 acetylase RimI-like enzyme